MSKRTVEVTFFVEVEMDDSKFTPEFMSEFQQTMFNYDTLDEHAEYLAWLAVRGLLDEDFTEGYGPLKDMGIKIVFSEGDTVITHRESAGDHP